MPAKKEESTKKAKATSAPAPGKKTIAKKAATPTKKAPEPVAKKAAAPAKKAGPAAKKAGPKATAKSKKRTTSTKKGDRLHCTVCGIVVAVEEECGCEACNIICCGEPMQARR
jgi:hypothetical protein